jgi:hypothetical protein
VRIGTTHYINNPILIWFVNTIYFAILITTILFSGYFGMTAGDCGLDSAIAETSFLLYGFILWNGFFYLLGIVAILVLLVSPHDLRKLPLLSLPDFLRASKLGGIFAILVCGCCYLIFKTIGSHAHCGIKIGF